MDGHPIFWVVDADKAGIHQDQNITAHPLYYNAIGDVQNQKNLIFYSHS